jgi:predicted Fe-Mo cluster-binding NifX family protein
MRFAIPTNYEGGLESPVFKGFSKCKYFIIVDADRHKIKKYDIMPNVLPPAVDQVTGVQAFFLAGKGVEAALVNRIAEKDRLALVGNNIRVFLGASGTASDALKQYFDGKLKESSDCKSGDICEC